MLLTVQELPDVNPSPTFETRKRIQSPNMQNASKSPKSPIGFYMDQNQNQSYSTISKKTTLNSETVASSRSRDFCETSSQTSTTLTPTESGRNTPLCEEQAHNDSDFYYNTHRTDTLKRRENQPNGITLQNPDQSSSYVLLDRSQSQQFASGLNANIPYHAREDSRPFTYVGDISEAKMIKMHSGLSSPSMVRKALGRGGQQTITTTTTTTKKLPINDFEEMLHSRHNEKYSFGDKTPTSDFNGSSSLHDKSHSKRFNTSGRNANESASYYRYNKSALGSNTSIENYNTESDGGYQFEPLRRSNTMDGSFGRDGYVTVL